MVCMVECVQLDGCTKTAVLSGIARDREVLSKVKDSKLRPSLMRPNFNDNVQNAVYMWKLLEDVVVKKATFLSAYSLLFH